MLEPSDATLVNAPRAAATQLVPGGLAGVASRVRAEHAGLLLTLGYLAIASCGMQFEALVFLSFRINIMDFAEPSDFLLAALRDPLILVAGVRPCPSSRSTSDT